MQTVTAAYQMGLRDGIILLLNMVKAAVEDDPQIGLAELLELLAAAAQQVGDYGGFIR